jgi:diguanylate cyclase (GGDEF)-like protein
MSTKNSKEIIAEYEKKLYDLRQLLEISMSLCSVLDFSTLTESILYICMCQMRVLGAGIFISKNMDNNTFTLDNTFNGLEPREGVTYSILKDSPVAILLEEKHCPLTLTEIKDSLPESVNLTALETLHPSLIVPLIHRNKVNGILIMGERIDLGEGTSYSDYDKEQIASLASLAAVAINNSTLLEMATTDMMTKLKLKHYFFSVLTDKMELSQSQNYPISVVMLDIDHFKIFNDTYGHACGDYVLIQVAKIIADCIRTKDIACRYGGEEFVVMLFNTDSKVAINVAERIRRKIDNAVLEYENQKLHVQISAGVACLTPKEKLITAKEFIDIADKGLYESKRTGRNKVTYQENT